MYPVPCHSCSSLHHLPANCPWVSPSTTLVVVGCAPVPRRGPGHWQTIEHLRTKSCRLHARDTLAQGKRVQVGSWPSGDTTEAWLWASRGLTPPSSLWSLSNFPRWWFGFSLQPQTSFPSPSQPPDVVTIATVQTSAAPNNLLPGSGTRLMALIPSQPCWSGTPAGRWLMCVMVPSVLRPIRSRVGWGGSKWLSDL